MRRLFGTAAFAVAVVLIAAPAAAMAQEDTGDRERELIYRRGPGENSSLEPLRLRMESQLSESLMNLGTGVTFFDLSRSVIIGKIAHYKFKVRFGPGPYDIIRMHRIVREKRPYRPARARDGILLMHGDILGIEGAWMANLTSPGVPADHSFPVFLARNRVDVWGVDMGWVLVPPEETDFSFMNGWNYDKELLQMDLALAIARAGRAVTGSGHGKIFTLGWSQGGGKLFAYASAETQRPPELRHVRGYIPVDMLWKITDDARRTQACDTYQWVLDTLATGEYVDATGTFFILTGELAEIDPGDPSPIFPGRDNYTAGLMFGTVPFGIPYIPYYHLVAGEFDASGLATGLRYSNVPYYFDWLQGAAPYEPLEMVYTVEAIACDWANAPWDDHLEEITAPMLFVLAGGGIYDPGYQTVPFLNNADLTTLIVQFEPPEDAALDFAHVDLWIADDAESIVWQPILERAPRRETVSAASRSARGRSPSRSGPRRTPAGSWGQARRTA